MLLKVPSSDNKLPASASKARCFLCQCLSPANIFLLEQVPLLIRKDNAKKRFGKIAGSLLLLTWISN